MGSVITNLKLLRWGLPGGLHRTCSLNLKFWDGVCPGWVGKEFCYSWDQSGALAAALF
jgi:hypothetical protein